MVNSNLVLFPFDMKNLIYTELSFNTHTFCTLLLHKCTNQVNNRSIRLNKLANDEDCSLINESNQITLAFNENCLKK